MKFVIIFAFAFIALPASAFERQVIGGDILYTSVAEASDASSSAFLAEQASIRLVITECSIPHKGIKIWNTYTKSTDNGFRSEAVSGISFENCEEGKGSKNPQSLINPAIVKSQAIYSRHLEHVLGIEKKAAKAPVMNEKQLKSIDEKLAELSHKLDRRQDAPVQQVIVIRESASVPSQPSQSFCHTQYASLMDQANTEAQHNYPPGNLAQGHARDLMNQADAVRRGCK